jgi:hypothetical protein
VRVLNMGGACLVERGSTAAPPWQRYGLSFWHGQAFETSA